MTRQYFGGDDTDEVCPSANGEALVLSHETHGFHEVHQQHDGFLLHEPCARVPNVGSLGRGGFPFVHRIILDPASGPRPWHLRWYRTASQEIGREGVGMVGCLPGLAIDEQVDVRALLVRAGQTAVTGNIRCENGCEPPH